MKKTILLMLLCISLLFTAAASSCSSGISKEQYDKLNQEAALLREKKAEAGLYVLFLDLLMYPLFKQANIPTRYTFDNDEQWAQALSAMARSLQDDQLTGMLARLQKGQASVVDVVNYVIRHTENSLK